MGVSPSGSDLGARCETALEKGVPGHYFHHHSDDHCYGRCLCTLSLHATFVRSHAWRDYPADATEYPLCTPAEQ